MPHLSFEDLAPVRTRLRIGAGSFYVKAYGDLTLQSWLEIQRDVQQVRNAEEAGQGIEARLLIDLLAAILHDAPPERFSVEEFAEALRLFYEGLPKPKADAPTPAKEPDYGVMLGQLSAFYGGGWHSWRCETSLPEFNAAIALLRPLGAELRLEQASVIALGNGRYEKGDASRITQAWVMEAKGITPAPEPQTVEEYQAVFLRTMASGGVVVQVMSANGTEDSHA